MSDQPANPPLPPTPEPEVKPRKTKKPPPWELPPDQFEVAIDIARQLHEPERMLIVWVVKLLGAEMALTLLQETLAVEAQGGWMLPDNSRRRTPGGVFLVLAKRHLTLDEQKQLHWMPPRSHTSTPATRPDGFNWKHRRTVIAQLRQQSGHLSTVKALLVGRPSAVTEHANYVVLTLTHAPQTTALPRGVPTPTTEMVSTYTVFIAAKQWKKVAAPLTDPEDKLIVEGLCVFNAALGGMAVYATSVTTRNLQIQQRQEK